MNRENAREYIPHIEALADGELQTLIGDNWLDTAGSEFSNPLNFYRRKPKQTVVPWTKETCPVGAVIKIKDNGNKYLILASVATHVLVRDTYFTYNWTLTECTMDDGSPCGVVQP